MLRPLKRFGDNYGTPIVISAGCIGMSLLISWLTIIEPLQKRNQISDWVEVPADIIEANLREGTIRDHETGFTSSVSECQARYRYTFAGQPYEHTRVSMYYPFGSAHDAQIAVRSLNGRGYSGFHRRICRELSNYQNSATPFRAYVNSEIPQQAILYRDVLWGKMLFPGFLAIFLGGCGIAVLVVTFKPQRSSKRKEDVLYTSVFEGMFGNMQAVKETRKNDSPQPSAQTQSDDYYAKNASMFLEQFFDKMTEIAQDVDAPCKDESAKSAKRDDKNLRKQDG